jgi:type II secretory pathway component PulK
VREEYYKMIQRQRGSVLIITLLVLFLLSTTALSLAHHMSLEMKLVNRYIERLKSFYIAQGALHFIINELENDKLHNQFDYLGEDWLRKFQGERGPKSLELLNIDGTAGGIYRALISDESSRININKATSGVVEALLNSFNKIGSEKVAEEILSYRRDKQPDSNFYSVYELLKLKRIKEEIFWGEDTNENGILDANENDGDESLPFDDQDGELDCGLKDLLTVYTDGKINVNTAPLPVLLSMPGMNREIARVLMEARDKQPFRSLEDLKKLSFFTDEVFAQISSWAVVKSDQFRVYIVAEASDAKTSRQILAIVDRSVDPLRIRYWRED